MKFQNFLISILLTSLMCVPTLVSAAGVSIRNENTYIDTRSRIATLKQILYSTAMTFDYSRLAVSIDGYQREPRGRMRDAQISLSPYIARDSEFAKLFVHELAHYIDLYVLVSGKNGTDISDTFYYVSWQKPTVKRASQGTMDFVSGYAAANQYEDFAESLVFYIFHNATFADRALRSESLRQKYLFFANSLFPRGYFQWTDFSIGRVPSYVWDTTKVSYSLQKYLYSL